MAVVDEFVDSRDGRSYKIIVIGDAVWMAENLDFRVEGSRAYENLPSNRKKYGLLYSWDAAKKAVPKGWRLPRESDFQTLFQNIGGESEAARMLLGESFGFNAKLSGFCNEAGAFLDLGEKTGFWCEENFGVFAYYMALFKNSSTPLKLFDSKKASFSVRCVL